MRPPRSSRPRATAAVLAAGLASAAAACGSDPTGSVGPSPSVGVYVLQTINGSALPYGVQTSTNVYTVVADTLRLGVSGGYTEFLVQRVAPPGQAAAKADTLQLTGTWSEAGSTIAIGGGRTGTLSGNTLTVIIPASQTGNTATLTQVYQR